MIIPPSSIRSEKPIRSETIWAVECIKAHQTEWTVYTEYETEERAMVTLNSMKSYKDKRLVRREIKEFLVETGSKP